jgi:hypothetical protein
VLEEFERSGIVRLASGSLELADVAGLDRISEPLGV